MRRRVSRLNTRHCFERSTLARGSCTRTHSQVRKPVVFVLFSCVCFKVLIERGSVCCVKIDKEALRETHASQRMFFFLFLSSSFVLFFFFFFLKKIKSICLRFPFSVMCYFKKKTILNYFFCVFLFIECEVCFLFCRLLFFFF